MGIALMYWDWFGSDEAMNQFIEIIESGCKGLEGIEYYGNHNVINQKYHWVMIFEYYNMDTFEKEITKMYRQFRSIFDSRQEYKKAMPYDHWEYFGGYLIKK